MDPEIEDTPSSINDNLFKFFMNRNAVSTEDPPTKSPIAVDFQI